MRYTKGKNIHTIRAWRAPAAQRAASGARGPGPRGARGEGLPFAGSLQQRARGRLGRCSANRQGRNSCVPGAGSGDAKTGEQTGCQRPGKPAAGVAGGRPPAPKLFINPRTLNLGAGRRAAPRARECAARRPSPRPLRAPARSPTFANTRWVQGQQQASNNSAVCMFGAGPRGINGPRWTSCAGRAGGRPYQRAQTQARSDRIGTALRR